MVPRLQGIGQNTGKVASAALPSEAQALIRMGLLCLSAADLRLRDEGSFA